MPSVSKNLMNAPSFHLGTKAAMVAGSEAMVLAKMTGRTPDMFTLMGRCVD